MRHVVRAAPTLAVLAPLTLAAALDAQEPPEPDPLRLEGLVVTATPVPLPPGSLGGHVTVLEGEELRARGISTVTEALRRRAGMSVVRSGSYGALTSLYLRGGESDYVQVMIDGVALNRPGGSVDLAGLTTEAVERIEVVRGPASALNGSDAVSGVVNIITRRGSSGGGPVGTLTLWGGAFGRPDEAGVGGTGGPPSGDRFDGVLEVRGGDERASYGVSLARYSTEGVFELNNRHRNSVLNGSAAFALSEASRARITARLADRSYHFPTDGAGNPVDINQKSFAQESTFGVEVGRRLAGDEGAPGAFDLAARLELHDLQTGVDDAPDGPADTLGFYGFHSLDAVRRTSADVRGTWIATERLRLVGGGELEAQSVRSFNESLSSFGPSTGRSDGSRSNRAAYLHSVLELPSLTGRAGLRVEDNEQFGTFLTWQVGAGWEVRPGTRLRGSAGRGIKEPTFFEAFARGFAMGNPDLDPERSRSWDLGVEQALGGVARAELTWFDQSFEDLIQYTATPPDPTDPNYFNVAEADARGLEAVLRAYVGGVSVSGAWTWLDTEVVDSGFDEGEGATFVNGEPLIRRPENQLRVSVAGPAGERVRWNASLGYTGERLDRDFAAIPVEPVTLDAYTTLDLGAELRAFELGGTSDVDLLVRAENVTGAEYQEAFGFDAPRRALLVGARVRLGGGR